MSGREEPLFPGAGWARPVTPQQCHTLQPRCPVVPIPVCVTSVHQLTCPVPGLLLAKCIAQSSRAWCQQPCPNLPAPGAPEGAHSSPGLEAGLQQGALQPLPPFPCCTVRTPSQRSHWPRLWLVMAVPQCQGPQEALRGVSGLCLNSAHSGALGSWGRFWSQAPARPVPAALLRLPRGSAACLEVKIADGGHGWVPQEDSQEGTRSLVTGGFGHSPSSSTDCCEALAESCITQACFSVCKIGIRYFHPPGP